VCLILRQIDVELIRIDFLTHNQHVFGFQNQLTGKKFMLNEKQLIFASALENRFSWNQFSNAEPNTP